MRKKKQTNSLKGVTEQIPTPKENGIVEAPPPPPPPVPANNIPTVPIEIPAPVKIIPQEEITTHYTQNSTIKTTMNSEQPKKPSERMSEQNGSTRSFDRQARSRACELL